MSVELDFETQLHSIPVRNRTLKVLDEESNSEDLVVEVELKYRGMMRGFARFVKARPRKRYELAGLSRDLFERLDGHTTVEQLIDNLCAEYMLAFLEGRGLVLQYLRDLMQRGLVVVVSPDDDA